MTFQLPYTKCDPAFGFNKSSEDFYFYLSTDQQGKRETFNLEIFKFL